MKCNFEIFNKKIIDKASDQYYFYSIPELHTYTVSMSLCDESNRTTVLKLLEIKVTLNYLKQFNDNNPTLHNGAK